MPRCRAPVRRGDARAAIFIILAIGLFAIVGLILALVTLAAARRTVATKPSPLPPQPVVERFGGLLCHCPPDAVSVTAGDLTILYADQRYTEIGELLIGPWQRANEMRFAKVPLTAADVDAFVVAKAIGEAELERDLPPQDRRGTLTVIRFNRPVTEGDILRGVVAGTFKTDDRISDSGARYHSLFRTVRVRDHDEREDDVSLRLADDRTLLIATTRREMEESMRRRPGVVDLHGALHSMVEKSDGAFVYASAGPSAPRDDQPARFLSFRTAVGRTITDHRAASIWFTFRGDRVEYRESFRMKDAARATALRDALVAECAKGAPAPPASEALTQFIAAARVNTAGDFVTVSASVAQDRFIQALKAETAAPAPKSK